jgi:hypothetical protein
MSGVRFSTKVSELLLEVLVSVDSALAKLKVVRKKRVRQLGEALIRSKVLNKDNIADFPQRLQWEK